MAAADSFCGRCGARQPRNAGTGPHPAAHDPFGSMTPRTASILCYVPLVGWVVSIMVLASQKYRHSLTVRFHAFQGLYLFVAWIMNEQVLRWVLRPVANFHLQEMVSVVLLGMSIFMIVKASHDEMYALPLFGELAHRSVTEG